jgi:hypothetical protein
MLEPMRTVETEETPGAGRFVERPVGERNEMPGARAAAEGSTAGSKPIAGVTALLLSAR